MNVINSPGFVVVIRKSKAGWCYFLKKILCPELLQHFKKLSNISSLCFVLFLKILKIQKKHTPKMHVFFNSRTKHIGWYLWCWCQFYVSICVHMYDKTNLKTNNLTVMLLLQEPQHISITLHSANENAWAVLELHLQFYQSELYWLCISIGALHRYWTGIFLSAKNRTQKFSRLSQKGPSVGCATTCCVSLIIVSSIDALARPRSMGLCHATEPYATQPKRFPILNMEVLECRSWVQCQVRPHPFRG